MKQPDPFAPEQIAELRQTIGWTQVTLAQFLRVAPRTIQNWESGKVSPNEYQIVVLRQLLHRLQSAQERGEQEDVIKDLNDLLPQVAYGGGLVLLFRYLFKED